MRMTHGAAVFLLATMLLGGGFRPPPATAPLQMGVYVGQMAPDFTLETVDGKALRLSDLRGQAVFLNFWASWCGPCRLEMPEMQRLWHTLPADTTLLAVNATDSETGPAAPVQFLAAHRYDFPVVLDRDGRVESLFRVVALPTSVFLDANGIVRKRVAGPMTSAAMVAALADAARLGGTTLAAPAGAAGTETRTPEPPPAVPAAGADRPWPPWPEVLALGPLRLGSNGLMALAGLLVASLLAAWSARRRRLPAETPGDLLMAAVVGGIMGAKVLALAQDPGAYLTNPGLVLAGGSPTTTLWGGLLGATAGLGLTARRHWLILAASLDALAAPVLAGLALAGLGIWPSPWPAVTLLVAAGLAAAWPRGRRAGSGALVAVLLGASALATAGFSLPHPIWAGGLSALQAGCGLAGLGAYACITRLEPAQG